MDPDKPCLHEFFSCVLEINRLSQEEGGPITSYMADLAVQCAECEEPFVFIGVDPGLSPRGPRMSVDAVTLRAPIRPKTAPEDFGLDGPGFDVRRIV